MTSSYLGLLVHISLATAIPVLDNGMGEKVSRATIWELFLTDLALKHQTKHKIIFYVSFRLHLLLLKDAN